MVTLEHKLVDEELSQSKARVVISELSLFIFLVIGKTRHSVHVDTLSDSLVTIVSYLAFSLVWYFMVKKFPNKCPWRRYLSMMADLSIMTVFFHLGGINSSIVYSLFLWIIIGNGIRFGKRYLTMGIGLGVAGFSSILAYAPFWKDNFELTAGLLIGVIILPIFFFSVLERLKAVTNLEIELARSRLADRAKDEFLATMSHELRTPMNGVLGMAETLRDSDMEPQQKEQVNIITRSVESLLHIINDILDYSKIAAGTLAIESVPFDLKQALTDVQILMDSAASEKRLKMEFEYDDGQHQHFKGDAIRIRQLVFNLVGNAVKFTETGGLILRCLVKEDDQGAHISLVVRDTGIGIPKNRLGRIFGHFEQVDGSNTRKYGGAGLGLSISRQLAVMMGGDITVESEVGRGSTFTATFRLEPIPAPEVLEVGPTQKLPEFGYKALVVEDNKFNQVVVLKLLKKIGIACEVAENGKQAVEMIDKSDYDLVFMDVRMPIMNGYEATEAIRARRDELSEIPILALTGEATKSDVAKCLESGMNLHLSKPVRLAVVVEAIQSLCLPEKTRT